MKKMNLQLFSAAEIVAGKKIVYLFRVQKEDRNKKGE